jgi:hypothetical protein
VQPVFETWKTPDNYRRYPEGKDLPDRVKVWRVQQSGGKEEKFLPPYGAVTGPWKPADFPGTEMLLVGYNTGKMNGAVAVGRDGNFLQWGFSAPPSKMTAAGRNLFVNCICYVAKMSGRGNAAVEKEAAAAVQGGARSMGGQNIPGQF